MSSKKVLVVHDDASYAEEVRRSLAEAGLDMQVISALSAPRALSMVSTITPDIVIADAELLGMDGYAMSVGGILVQVPENEADDARELLASEPPEETSAEA